MYEKSTKNNSYEERWLEGQKGFESFIFVLQSKRKSINDQMIAIFMFTQK